MVDSIPEESLSYTEAYERFFPIIMRMVQSCKYEQAIDEQVYQPYNKGNQALVLEIISALIRPESRIVNEHVFEKLADIIPKGKSCLLLPEHFSNFDVPGLFYLSQKNKTIAPLFQNLICMAASKLNTESKIVLAFSEAFHRIMIYPARSKQNANDQQIIEEQKQLDVLNQRALRTMLEYKKKGHMILVFPSGTRYRANKPDTRHALPQIPSFIKQFDYFCLVGIAGNLLQVNPNNYMAQDIAREDTLVYWVDEPRSSKEFLQSVHDEMPDARPSDIKNAAAQRITAMLMDLHEKAEAVRKPLVDKNPPRYLGLFVPPNSGS